MIQAVTATQFQRHPSDVKALWKSYAAQGKAPLSSSQVREMVRSVALSVTQKKEACKAVDFLSKNLPLKLLEDAAGVDFLHAAKDFLRTFHCFLPQVQKMGVGNSLRSSFHSFFVALESFLKSLGLIDLFKPVIGTHDVETKGHQMILLTTLFSTLTTTLIPLLGPVTGGAAIGGAFVFLMTLSAFYPLWRPLPNYLPKVENWTEKYTMGVLETGDIRRELLDQIVGALKSSKQDHSQVMLIGKSGVGKTELVKTLVQAIASGDYPEFKGCQVFYINTADLLSETSWVPKAHSILSFFSDAIDGYRDRIIFVFDQMHLACQMDPKSLLAEQFNTMFDRSKEFFPHVIGITTGSDFRELHKTHPSFSGRFQCIPIEATNDEETLHILQSILAKHAPEILVEEKTFKVLLEKTRAAFGKEASMPKSAVRILSQCMQRASKDQKSAVESEAKALFFARRELLLEMKRRSLKMSSGSSDKEKKAFLLFSRMICPILEKELRNTALLLGFKAGIDEALIDQVIAEEKVNQKKLRIDLSEF